MRTNDACFLPLASPARSPHDYNGATPSSKTSPHTKQISPRSPPHPPRAYSWRGRGGAADPAAPRPTPPPPSTQSPPAVGASPPGSDSPVPPSPGARPVGARSGMRRRPSARRVTAATAAGGHPFHQPPVWYDWPTFPPPSISRIVNLLIFRPNLPSDVIYRINRHRRRTTSVRGGQPSSTYSRGSNHVRRC